MLLLIELWEFLPSKNLVQDKLFIKPEIKENFIGITHDFASSLSEVDNGLVALIERDLKREFFDLCDPCHGLSLAIRNSLGHLPANLTNFITKIHSHFVSPQRKNQLIRIQEEKGMQSPLVLKKYVQTRWLSLGQSLERLLMLWDSLQIYMEENIAKNTSNSNKNSQINQKKVERKKLKNAELEDLNYETYNNLLKDDLFKMQISFLNEVISRVNVINERFQSRELSTHEIKRLSVLSYTSIAELIIKLSEFSYDPLKIIKQDLDQDETQNRLLMNQTQFFEMLAVQFSDQRFGCLLELHHSKKKKFF